MSKRAAESSYRPKGYGISPSLARARAPFRTQNVVTGFTLFGFAASVWAYSIYAVKQENFDDVDFEALNTSVEEKARRISLEDEARGKNKGSVRTSDEQLKAFTPNPSTSVIPVTSTTADQRGFLHRLPWVSKLYSSGETSAVSQSPPIDRVYDSVGGRQV